MDSKLLLISAITLLYRESLLSNETNSRNLIKEVVNTLNFKDASSEVSSANSVQIALRGTLVYMLEQPLTSTYDKESLLQRIRIHVNGDDNLYKVTEESLNKEMDEESTRSYCQGIRNDITTYLNKNKIREIVKDAFRKTTFEEDSVDWSSFVSQLNHKLEPYNKGLVNKDIAGMITSIDIDDEDALEEIMQLGVDSASTEGTMQTGWQGLNRALHGFGGLRRGDFYLIGALKHNYKSGLLTHIPKQVAIFNKPYMLDETKKPLIIYISLENNLNDNIIDIYVSLKAHEGINIEDKSTIDINEAKGYIKAKLRVNGYHFKMLKFDPTDFTYMDLFEMLDDLQAEGYEIHLVSMDYLNLMSKKHCEGGTPAEQIRDLFRRVRNYCNPKRITMLTAHQLSADAVLLDRMGNDDFVLEVSDKSYYDSAKNISQEVDVEIAIKIHRPGDGFAYLDCCLGKLRGGVINEATKRWVYRFDPYKSLPEDFGLPDESRKRVGSPTMSSGKADEKTWWS